MQCSRCDGRLLRFDKKIGAVIVLGLGILMGLQLKPAWSAWFAGSAYLWLIMYMVPGILLLLAKPRYSYWCPHCKKMVLPKGTEDG